MRSRWLFLLKVSVSRPGAAQHFCLKTKGLRSKRETGRQAKRQTRHSSESMWLMNIATVPPSFARVVVVSVAQNSVCAEPLPHCIAIPAILFQLDSGFNSMSCKLHLPSPSSGPCHPLVLVTVVLCCQRVLRMYVLGMLCCHGPDSTPSALCIFLLNQCLPLEHS